MGTRKNTSEKSQKWKDHPHAYGDKSIAHSGYYLIEGSSPRVWGQVSSNYAVSNVDGIIPTRMGTSYLGGSFNNVHRDHPHAYGDKTKEIKENSGFAKSTA